MSIKDWLYNKLVRGNPNVQYEYERYVQEHLIEHFENRSRHRRILLKLIWHYRIQKKTEPMLYWDRPNIKGTLISQPGTLNRDHTKPFPVQVTAITSSTITLIWGPCTDADHYLIMKCIGSSSVFQLEGSTSKTFFNVKKLLPNTQYKFRVDAMNQNSMLICSEEMSIRTTPPDQFPIAVTDVKPFHIVLLWDPQPHATQYTVMRYHPETDSFIPDGSTEQTEYKVGGLEPGASYRFYVKGMHGAVLICISREISQQTTIETGDLSITAQETDPAPERIENYNGEPIIVRAEKIECRYVSLAWNMAPGITSYTVQKWDQDAQRFRTDGKTIDQKFNVKRLEPDTPYQFRICANYLNETLAYSNIINIRTLVPINHNVPNPYLDGAESQLYPRRTAHFLAKELMSYDIISFDIFDTLVFCPFQNSRDLFMLLDDRFDMLGFSDIRQRAENKVREQAYQKKATGK